MQDRFGALLAAHVAAVLFGMTGVLGALIQADAWTITFGRAVFAVLALSGIAALTRQPLLRDAGWPALRLWGQTGALLAVHWVTFFVAVKVGGVAVATLGFAGFPAFIALIDATVYREAIGHQQKGLIVLVTVGLALVTPALDWRDQGTVGLLWGVASGFAFAALAVTNRRHRGVLGPLQQAWGQNVVVALLMVPAVAWGPWAPLAWTDGLYLMLLGVFCTGASQYLFVRSLGTLDARTVGLIIALEPVYAIAASWALFGQMPTARMLVGAALIVAASLWVARPPRAGRRPAAAQG